MTKNSISVIFAGTPAFAVPALRSLIDDPDIDVKAVLSQPDKPVGRAQTIMPTPVKEAALEAGIDVLQPQSINKDYPDIDHDFLIVVAYGQIIKQHILDAPNSAALNVHASLLPRWRGASPMQHSILEGDSETGITIQRMVMELDAGPILAQASHTMQPRETITSLHDTLARMGGPLLLETIKHPLAETEQNQEHITHCHKLSRKTGDIDPTVLTAVEVDRHVRALVPWPGVRATVGGMEVKILETSLSSTEHSIPLVCSDTDVHVVTVQPPGKTPMSGKDFLRGRL